MSDKKKIIELEVELTNNDKRKYTGRFLGFIKDDEFNAITQSKELIHKVESKETKSITAVCAAMDTLNGQRLVMTIKKINGVNVTGKKLFVSEKLNYVSSVAGKEVQIVQDNGNDIDIEEI